MLFIVTDGLEDKQAATCAQTLLTAQSISRCIQPFDVSLCPTIRQRGIQIAILYTEYFPLPNESFYVNHISSFQDQIGPNLQSCASPGLFFTVTTDQDITNAMNTVFQATVSRMAHLTH